MEKLNVFYAKWTPHLLSILRIVTAFLFMTHGAQKFFGFPAPMPGPLPTLLLVAAALEFFGGLLLLLGLFTRPVSLILAGEMAVAYFLAHAPGGFWPLMNKGELAVLYCFVFLFMAVAGAGSWSIDRLWRRGEL